MLARLLQLQNAHRIVKHFVGGGGTRQRGEANLAARWHLASITSLRAHGMLVAFESSRDCTPCTGRAPLW